MAFPSVEERNARLAQLRAAAQQWASRERERLNAQVDLGKRVLQGRTGSERLAQSNVSAVSELTVDEINQFLTGE